MASKKEVLARLQIISDGMLSTYTEFAKDYARLVRSGHGESLIAAGEIARAMARLIQAQVDLEATRSSIDMDYWDN
jgi:hypothetical protein